MKLKIEIDLKLENLKPDYKNLIDIFLVENLKEKIRRKLDYFFKSLPEDTIFRFRILDGEKVHDL